MTKRVLLMDSEASETPIMITPMKNEKNIFLTENALSVNPLKVG